MKHGGLTVQNQVSIMRNDGSTVKHGDFTKHTLDLNHQLNLIQDVTINQWDLYKIKLTLKPWHGDITAKIAGVPCFTHEN